MSKTSKLLLSTLFTSFVFTVLFVVSAHAQYLGFDVGDDTGLSSNDVRYNATQIIKVILQMLGTVAIIINVYAGFIWMTAGGNEDKVTEAKKWLTRGVVGLAIILSAYAITSFVTNSLVNATDAPGSSYRWNFFNKYTNGTCTFINSKTGVSDSSKTMTSAECSEIGGTWKAGSAAQVTN